MECILSARVAEIWEYDDKSLIHVVARMGQDLNFRKLRTPRRLLEIPVHRKHVFWEYVHGAASFPMPYANEILVAPFGTRRQDTCTKHLLVVTCSLGKFDSKDVIFLQKMSAVLTTVARCVQLRDERALSRRRTLQYISLLCTNNMFSNSDLKLEILAQIKHCLPRSNAYVGLLQTGGDHVSIFGRDERRSCHSPIFECVPPRSLGSILLPDPLKYRPILFQPGARVQVRYGKLWYDAIIQADRGHLKFDVIYDMKDWMGRRELEAGVPTSRMRHVPTKHPVMFSGGSATTKHTTHASWPLIIASMGHQYGIIGVDSWARGNAEPDHDESHIIHFLEMVGQRMGKSLDDKTCGRSLRYMIGLTGQRNLASPKDIKHGMRLRLQETAVFANQVCMWDEKAVTPGDLVARKSVPTGDLLNRCVEILASQEFPEATFLVQATHYFSEFMSIFKDCEVFLSDDGVPLLARPNLSLFCSLSSVSPGSCRISV